MHADVFNLQHANTTALCRANDGRYQDWYTYGEISHHITSHRGNRFRGLDRPVYLRNKLYDETLKSQNYYSNTAVSGAMEICLVVIQYLLIRPELI